MAGGDRMGGFEEKIGKILGILEPLPGHIEALYEKMAEESRTRMSGDQQVSNEVSLLKQAVEALKQAIAELKGDAGGYSDDRAECQRLHDEKQAALEARVKDVEREVGMKEGRAKVVVDLVSDTSANKAAVTDLQNLKTSAKSFFTSIWSHMVAIAVAVIIAYLLMKMGLSKP